MEKRKASHPQKPHATSQPSRFSHTPVRHYYVCSRTASSRTVSCACTSHETSQAVHAAFARNEATAGESCVCTMSWAAVRIAMAGWLHGVFVGEWLFVFPLCGFSLSLFCNYHVTPAGCMAGCMGFVWVHAESFHHSVASPFHSCVTTM